MIGLVLFQACDDDLDPNQGGHLWRADFATEQLASTFKPIILDDVVIYGNDVVVGTDWLIAYDKINGDKKWDKQSGIIKSPGVSARVVSQDNIAYLFNGGIITALRSNGVIKWSNEICSGFGERDLILNEHGLFVYCEINNHHGALFDIDIQDGSSNILVEYKNDHWLIRISDAHFFRNDNVPYLATTVVYVSTDFQNSLDTTYLYSLNNGIELVWKDDISPAAIGGIRAKDNNLIYYSDGKYRSFDLINFNENWGIELEPEIVGESIFIHNNNLYYAESGVAANSVTQFVRRSLVTGELEKRSAETYNFPLDGFVNDGEYLYAARSRTILQLSLDDFSLQQEYISPDYDNNSNAFFDGAITIDNNTGEMYAANFIAALKFKLIR